MHWHGLTGSQALERLGTDPSRGLSTDQARERLERHGPNLLLEKARRPAWRLLLEQFTDFMILVLIAAAVVSGVMGDIEDTLAIVVILLLNAVIGFAQAWRAERAMEALRRMAAATAVVVRDGQPQPLPAPALVPGDLVVLEAGNVVPADLRLLDVHRLKVGEAALTGESLTVDKTTDPIEPPASAGVAGLPLGDRHNLAFKGTMVTHGRGRGVVVATGMDTELGRIAALLEGGDDLQTPLQRRLASFGKRLGLAVLAICAAVFAIGLMRGEPVLRMLMTAVSLAVAAIPEALPAIVTITLALGARSMVRRHALIRRLPAVETLGSVTFICSDKTGTLTRNEMHVEALFAAGQLRRDWHGAGDDPAWAELLQAIALNNDARAAADGTLAGDPTETALLRAARQAGFDRLPLEAQFGRIAELPFDSERKCMTTVHRDAAGFVAYTKGAPEMVLERCTHVNDRGGERPLDRAALLAQAEALAADGLRVLAIARRRWLRAPSESDPDAVESGLTLLGLAGLIDPPRDEAAAAVRMCQTAGITPVMITGDHPTTARAIALRLGIAAPGDGVISGPELAAMSDEALRERVNGLRVYARVDPAQKIRIVQALQQRGEFVAMTGDGVNDAPALRHADIGVAMGLGGTDVAREASSLVLLDDNFATIVEAVREGRRIFDNIRKFIRFAMTGNSGEIWTILLAPLLGMPMPLLPIHILWVNLVTDGLPGLALAAEPEEAGIMRRPPRPPAESLFAHGMWQHIVWVGLLIGGVSLFAQAWAIRNGSAHWQTMVFTVLTLSQMAHVLAIRSERESLFRQGLWSNRPLLAAVALTFALQMAVIYLPALNAVFSTAPLSASELLTCLLLAATVFVAVEIEKALVRRGRLYREAPARAGA
jgi:Ca2+-transporting ATPase